MVFFLSTEQSKKEYGLEFDQDAMKQHFVRLHGQDKFDAI